MQIKPPAVSLKAAVAAVCRTIVALALPAYLAAPFVGGTAGGVAFYRDHLTYPLFGLVFLLAMVVYGAANYSRTHPPKDKRGRARRDPKPPWLKLRRVIVDCVDIVANLDTIPWRVYYALAFVVAIICTLRFPVALADLSAVGENARSIIISAAVPVLLPLIVIYRLARVTRGRYAWIEQVHSIARDTLKYKPAPQRGNVTRNRKIINVPHLAVQVRKWKTLTEGDVAFIAAPEELSATAVEEWDELDANLSEKLPRPEEWRIRTKGQRGKGAIIGPANYPRSILWDGDIDPDPLTFVVGDNLETGDRYRLTFNDASPHAVTSGGTSSGKTSFAEIVAAQVLLTPMPWDPSLYGQVHVVDPKGPFARRWQGRPNVIVSNGQQDSEVEPYIYDDDGNVICENTGVMVMMEHLQFIEAEHKRRANVLAKYPNAGTWMDLSDEVKRKEKFFPILVIADEFLDHTTGSRGRDRRTEMENEAREFIVTMVDWHLRKSRNVGIHYDVIAQRANMKLIGDTMMTNMPIRMVTGQIDKPQLGTMFAVEPSMVPRLPSTIPGTTKTIPGRGRIMNALGQTISKIQVMWFGGDTNSGTLDKWLPRGEKPKNGDFSLPKNTRQRRPDEFDENGTLIGEKVGVEDLTPAESEEIEQAQHEPDAEGTLDDAIAAAEEYEEDLADADADEPAESPEDASADDPDDPGESEEPPAEASDADGEPSIFPNRATPDACEDTSCGAPAAWSCPECGSGYCTEHGGRTPNPDPDSKYRFLCASCAERSPLTGVGLAAVLPTIATKARRYRLAYEHAIREDDNGIYGVVTVRAEPGGRKIVEVFARPNGGGADGGFAYRARTSSGAVDGLAPAEDRIDTAISSFVRTRTGNGSQTEQATA